MYGVTLFIYGQYYGSHQFDSLGEANMMMAELRSFWGEDAGFALFPVD